jgi:Tfp pilus assembly protein PilZ
MSDALVFGERRNHLRKTCTLTVELNDLHKPFRGHMRNIGLGGAFVETDPRYTPRIGQEFYITIPFQLKPHKITLKGRITRVRWDGLGISFIKALV